ncbi:MAG: hypothetical protein KDA24_27455 [Deltaproteobacteria bacterium]|nr:hypothetical protein [Deltaproteobacteria bacterium]
MVHPLSERHDETRPGLHLVLPDPFEVAPVRTALSLLLRGRGALRAHSLRRPGEDLPPELRIARYGLGVRRDADRAVSKLVEAAVRGAHVDVRPLPPDEAGRAATANMLAEAAESTLLLVAWTRQGELPDPARLEPLLTRYRGPVGLLIDDRGPPLREVLGVGPGPGASPASQGAVDAASELLDAIERSHPTWRLNPSSLKEAQVALADVGPRTLVVMPVVDHTPEQLGDPETLELRLPGRLLLVFGPSESRAARLLALCGAISAGRAARAAS